MTAVAFILFVSKACIFLWVVIGAEHCGNIALVKFVSVAHRYLPASPPAIERLQLHRCNLIQLHRCNLIYLFLVASCQRIVTSGRVWDQELNKTVK